MNLFLYIVKFQRTIKRILYFLLISSIFIYINKKFYIMGIKFIEIECFITFK